MRPSAFNAVARVVEPAFLDEQLRQGIIIPKFLVVPVERRRGPDSCLEVAGDLLRFALGKVHIAEDTMTSTDYRLTVLARGEVYRSGCGLFCGVELGALIQQPSETS